MTKIFDLKIVLIFFTIAFVVMCCFQENCPKNFPRGQYKIKPNHSCANTIENGVMLVEENNVVIDYVNTTGEDITVTYRIVNEYFN